MEKSILSDIFAILVSFVVSYLFVKSDIELNIFNPHGSAITLFIVLLIILTSQTCKDAINSFWSKTKILARRLFTIDNAKKPIIIIVKSLTTLSLLIFQFIVYLIYAFFANALFPAKTIFLINLTTAVIAWSNHWFRVFGVNNTNDVFLFSVTCGLVNGLMSLILFKFLVLIKPKIFDEWFKKFK